MSKIYNTKPTLKQLFVFVFSFLSLCIFAQQKDTHQIKIYLEDAETGKNIDDAKVTLEGFEIPAITANYDKKNKYYFLPNRDYSNYKLIYVDSKNNEPQIFKKTVFPEQLTINLFKRGTTVETKTEYIKIWTKEGAEDSIINSTNKNISTLDHYKRLILLKNSSNLTFSEIRAKIDSLVVPFGLEYIEDLVPKMYFIKFYGSENCTSPIGENSIICNINENKSLKTFFKENIDRITYLGTTICSTEDTQSDFFSENKDPYNNQYDWKKNSYILPYRKKNKESFRLENDSVINKIIKNTTQLEFGKIKYNKFDIYNYISKNKKKSKEEIKNHHLKELDDKIMNYRFLNKYDNDYSRILLMDYNIRSLYLDNNLLQELKDYSVAGIFQFKTNWKHAFILDEELLTPEKQTTDFYNKTNCNLQRHIGYSFLFD